SCSWRSLRVFVFFARNQSLDDADFQQQIDGCTSTSTLKQSFDIRRLIDIQRDSFVVDHAALDSYALCFLFMQRKRVRSEARTKQSRRRANDCISARAFA